MAIYEKEFSYLRIDMSAYTLVNRLTIFYNLVKNRGPLDLKNVKGWQSINFIYNYEYLANDAPRNILYGYVGKVFGFNDKIFFIAPLCCKFLYFNKCFLLTIKENI